MADKIHEQTDKKLAAMEQHLTAIFSRANDEVGKNWKAFLKQIGKEITDLEKAYVAETDADRAAELKAEIRRLKTERTIRNKHFKALSKATAEQLAEVNETALAYINGELPYIYSINYNFMDDQTAGIAGYSFTMVDADTVAYLATQDATLLPYKGLDVARDVAWNMRNLQAEVLQGILQGQSMDDIADRLSRVIGMNQTSAIRAARTSVTSAENKGRQDSYARAEAEGIILEKEWISTLDNKTRHAHRQLNHQPQPQDKPFESELGPIMYPGDPEAAPANVYNCRCTTVANVKGFRKVR